MPASLLLSSLWPTTYITSVWPVRYSGALRTVRIRRTVCTSYLVRRIPPEAYVHRSTIAHRCISISMSLLTVNGQDTPRTSERLISQAHMYTSVPLAPTRTSTSLPIPSHHTCICTRTCMAVGPWTGSGTLDSVNESDSADWAPQASRPCVQSF